MLAIIWQCRTATDLQFVKKKKKKAVSLKHNILKSEVWDMLILE